MKPCSIFLGAHCTVTSRILRDLEQNASILEDFGISVLLPRHLRDWAKEFLAGASSGKVEKFVKRKIRSVFQEMQEDYLSERLVICEDALLGSPGGNFLAGDLYPNVSRRMSSIPSILDNPTTTIFLCTRSYDSFFVASYVDLLERGIEVEFDAFRHQYLKSDRIWFDIIEEIYERLPNASLVVWKFENQKPLNQLIEGKFLGGDLGVLTSPSSTSASEKSFSQDFLESFWSAQEQELLVDRYSKEWDHLLRCWPELVSV